MREVHHPLDPVEALTIRRIFTPDRVPNKGKATYRFDTWHKPFLEENGWEFVGQNQRDRAKAYFRSPGGLMAKSFTINVAIPNDDAILRLAETMIRFATLPPGPNDPWCFDGQIGHFPATFFTCGRRTGPDRSNQDYPGAEEDYRRDRSPTLSVGVSDIWRTCLWWLDGVNHPPSWDRTEYFSALVPGLSPRGELYSDLEIIHAAELKRYEDGLARQSPPRGK